VLVCERVRALLVAGGDGSDDDAVDFACWSHQRHRGDAGGAKDADANGTRRSSVHADLMQPRCSSSSSSFSDKPDNATSERVGGRSTSSRT